MKQSPLKKEINGNVVRPLLDKEKDIVIVGGGGVEGEAGADVSCSNC